LHALRNHVVHGVAAATAHAHHLDNRFLRLRIDKFYHVFSPLCVDFKPIQLSVVPSPG
jgi:hypothetical protein